MVTIVKNTSQRILKLLFVIGNWHARCCSI